MDEFQRHGDLITDEKKLARNFGVAQGTRKIGGFVDLGVLTPGHEKSMPCKHSMVVMFQPLSKSWYQILGIFAFSSANMKVHLLSKIILEAAVLSEKAELKVDYVTYDRASCNRARWHQFGVHGMAGAVMPSVHYPTKDGRHLFILLDYPHLVKCVRNSFTKGGCKTPVTGHVDVRPIKVANQLEKCATTLKVMPKVTHIYINPNNCKKMKVNYAFHLFSNKVVRGFFFFFLQRGNLKVLHIQSTNRTARRLYAETDFCHDLKSTSSSTEKEC